MDLVYIALAVAFVAAVWGLIAGCARLQSTGGRS
jgi:hypothetical protein